ncbi:autotransporter assembly complex protein TamA [Reinekea sp.]|jgi:translocation and assembly module TamA|uniref:autotransporter assembly complex protein TamA n=1 Tax=Reinekea sp. TaxID=1970455 RepID=UPI002A8011A3|nr:BamA/TamA family outer membrane protein [Reinekea sp.]
MMKYLNITLVLVLLSLNSADAGDLRSASRGDISLKPYRFELKSELVRAVEDYRKAVNQTNIEPSRDRQIRAEKTRLEQLVKSRGYYQATVDSAWDEIKSTPLYQIILGPQFEINKLSLSGNFAPEDDSWRVLTTGDALNAALVLSQQAKLRQYIEAHNCFYNLVIDHRVTLNEVERSGDVDFQVSVSDPAVLGRVKFEGAASVDEEFLWRVTGIRDNDCYRRSVIDGAVISLFDTGLFSQVRPVLSRNEAGQVIVTFGLEKRKDRTLRASAGWKSEQGLGGSVGWQHRDLFGKAQSLALGLALQSSEQTASANIVVPSFLDRRNRLNWDNEISHADVLGIESIGYSSIARLARKASVQDYYEYGLGVKQLDERTNGQWDSYRQVRLPLKYRYDSVQDPFNPGSGLRTSFGIEPVWDVDENFTPFVLSGVGLQYFRSLDSRVTLASRLRWDSLWYGDGLGSTQNNIPESEWLTAGGSTSIRGYGYQSIQLAQKEISSANPAEVATELSGATQRWLMVNELRLRVNDSWGGVAFWDVGALAEGVSFDAPEQWYHGIGLGVRYFTRFAPIRIDVALPLKRRASDDGFQVYVSLGQAF